MVTLWPGTSQVPGSSLPVAHTYMSPSSWDRGLQGAQGWKGRGCIAPAIVVLLERQVQHCQPSQQCKSGCFAGGQCGVSQVQNTRLGVRYKKHPLQSMRPRVGISRTHIKSGVLPRWSTWKSQQRQGTPEPSWLARMAVIAKFSKSTCVNIEGRG
jgi:hypothetical protein